MDADADDIEYALSLLMDEWRGTPMTSEDVRRETIQFVLDNVEGTDRGQIEAMYDGLYPPVPLGQRPWMG